LTKEETLGLRMILRPVVSQEHRDPKTSASGFPGTVQIGLIVALRHTSSWQPLGAYNELFALAPATRFTALYRTGEVKRTQANKGKLRLKTGATGHDEGNAIVIRSLTSCTRAPSLSKRTWIVSIVAAAHWVLLHTSRRKVSSNT